MIQHNLILPKPRPLPILLDDYEGDIGAFDKTRFNADNAAAAEKQMTDKELATLYGMSSTVGKPIFTLYLMIGSITQALGKALINDFTMSSFSTPDNYTNGLHVKESELGLGTKIKETEDGVVRTFDMAGFSSYVDAKVMQNADTVKTITREFRRFFPEIKLDLKWEKVDDVNEHGETVRVPVFGLHSDQHSFSMNEMINLLKGLPTDIRRNSGGTTVIKATREFLKQWGDRVFFDLQMDSVHHAYVPENESKGEISEEDRIPFEVKVQVRINFPWAGAEWMTGVSNPNDFSLLTFLRHLAPTEQQCLLPMLKKMKSSEITASPLATHRMLADIKRITGAVPKRMSVDGFTILENGNVIYSNLEADIDLWRQAEDDAYDEKTKSFRHDAIGKAGTNFKNKLLSVDWEGNIILYTNAAGFVDSIGLQGSQALTDRDIGDQLRQESLLSSNSAKEVFLENLCNRIGATYENPSRIGVHSPIDLWVEEQESGEPYERFASRKRRAEMFKELWTQFDESPMSLLHRIEFRYYVALYGYYARPENQRKYIEADLDATNQLKKKVDLPENVTAINMDGVEAYYPHQRRILKDVHARQPHNIMLGAAPGAGKTVTYTSFIMDYLDKGIGKRPLIVMPGQLKPQYFDEIRRFSKGKVRIFTIYLKTWDRLQNLGFDLAILEALIMKQPKNTIYLTDFNFVKARPRKLYAGRNKMSVYSIAVWASRIFDIVLADESQKIKKMDPPSAMSLAFRTLTPYTTVKCLASGTLVYNNARDMVGQANVFSPNILGSVSSFADTYEITKGKIDRKKMPAFNARIDKYVRRYHVPKREFSFLLPKINYNTESVSMSRELRTLYQKSLEQELEAIRQLMKEKKLDADNIDDEAKILSLMQTRLTPLEIFINAPDVALADHESTNTYSQAYVRLPAVKANPELLKSPKIDKLDEILKMHFSKTDSKVIVMSYNKAISKHVMRHSKYHRKMIHYHVGADIDTNAIIKEFRENPQYTVMVADENTLKEGYNLQFASRMIRMQTVWTIGEFEQAISRVERPDRVQSDGSLEHNRKSIDFDWLLISPSLEIAKTARLFSKIIEATKVQEYDEDDPNNQFTHWMSGRSVRGVKYLSDPSVTKGVMNVPELMDATNQSLSWHPDTIMEYDTFDKLALHAELYRLYNQWLDNEFSATKEDLRNAIAKKQGVDPKTITDNALRLAAIVKPKYAGLEGTEVEEFGNDYLPFVPGVPPKDPYNLGLMSASTLVYNDGGADEDSDDDNYDEDRAEIEDNIQLETGMIVMTEFGIGKAIRKTSTSRTIYVEIPSTTGRTREVGVPITSVYIPEKPANRRRLENIYNAMKKHKLPTTIITHEGIGHNEKLHFHDIYVPEKDLHSGAAIKPHPPLYTIDIGKQRLGDTRVELEDVKVKTATRVGAGVSPRSGAKPEITPPTVTRHPPESAKEADSKPKKTGRFNIPGLKARSRPGAVKETPVPQTTTKIRLPVKAPAKREAPETKVRVPVKQMLQQKVRKIPAELHLMYVNNQLVVAADTPEERGEEVFTNLGFHRIGTSVAAEVQTAKGLDKLITYLDDNFNVSDEAITDLENGLKVFRQNEHKMLRVTHSLAKQSNFMKFNRKKSSNNEIHPYLAVMDDQLRVIINAAVGKDARRLVGKHVAVGVSRFEKVDPFYLRFTRGFEDMREVLDEVDKKCRIINLTTLEKEYREVEK